MIYTTLNKIRANAPCKEGWVKLLAHLGKTTPDDEPLPFLTILESNGIEDAIWCTRSAPEYAKEWRLFAVWCARQVSHLMKDPRSLRALDVVDAFARGDATAEELEVARRDAYAAYTAADAADAAAYAAYDADAADAAAAYTAADAAYTAAADAAADAAYAAYAAYDAAYTAADAAADAAYAAAADAAAYTAAAYAAAADAAAYTAAAARTKARSAQAEQFRKIVQGVNHAMA